MVGSPPRPDASAKTGQVAAEAVRALVLSMLRWRPLPRRARIDADDLVQRVLLTILRRNRQPSAYDPRLASFSKYVLVVARSVAINMLAPAKRHARLALPGELPDVAADMLPQDEALQAEKEERARVKVQAALPWGDVQVTEARTTAVRRRPVGPASVIRVGGRWWDGERLRAERTAARPLAQGVAEAAAAVLRAEGVAGVEVLPASVLAEQEQTPAKRTQMALWSDRDLEEVAARFAA